MVRRTGGHEELRHLLLRPGCSDRIGLLALAAYNLPADTTVLASGTGAAASLPAGSVVLPNEARLEKFIGATPPEGTGVHRYFFVVDALDVDSLDLDAGATPAVLGFNRHFHSLARGVLLGTADPSER